MTTLDEIAQYIADYKNPRNLGMRAIDAITRELYESDPHTCKKMISELYMEAVNGFDREFRMHILYKWLDISDLNDVRALAILYSSDITDLLSYNVATELKNKILDNWITHKPLDNIISLFQLISEHLSDANKYLTHINKFKDETTKIDTIYPPNTNMQLSLIIRYILPNLTNLHNDPTNPILNLDNTHRDASILLMHLAHIISKLDLDILPEKEAVKLLALSPYFGINNNTRLGNRYMPDTYNQVLATAEALDVVHNPDYWVQNLPSQQKNHIDSSIELPVFE